MNRRHFCLAVAPLAAAVQSGAAQLPRPSLDLSMAFPGSPPVSLSKYRGKVIAVEFLLTTCPHCQKTAQAIERVYRELGPKGFQPVGLAINPDPDLEGFRKRFNLSFPVGTIPQEKCSEYMQHPSFLRLMMPQLAFIDRKFMVRAQYPGDAPFFSDSQEKNIRGEVAGLL